MPPRRAPNRLLVLCASINDVTAWPFWKFLQMKKIRGVTDMALLAFNSDGGSFEARIDGDKYELKNYAKVRGYQHDMFESFVQRWHDPGRSYFVYGGHGMGDYVELEQHRVSLQAHELAAVFGKRTFEAVLFDACFMANLDCAYHLRHNTRYIGACEGYMWEPDTALDYHVFNTHNASAMSRFKDPLHVLRTIQADYCGKALRGDFSILDTTHVAELRQFVQEHVMQRVYDRATFYSLPQRERLQQLAEAASQAAIAEFGHPGGDANVLPDVANGLGRPRTAPNTPGALAMSAATRPSRKQRLLQAIQFEHSLYPSEVEDKQLLDLKSYLTDMALEAQQRTAWENAAVGPPRRVAAGRRRVRSDHVDGSSSSGGGGGGGGGSAASSSFAVFKPSPSRALFVDRHGRLPPTSVAAAASDSTAETTRNAIATPTASPAPLTPTSPGYKGSAQEGLDLFHQVVVSHVQPKAAAIYAAQLGGLSFTVHEYSAMSRPVEPWVVESKRLLKRRAKLFLKNGELAEVEMEKPKPHPSLANSKLLAAVEQAKPQISSSPSSLAAAAVSSTPAATAPSTQFSASTAATSAAVKSGVPSLAVPHLASRADSRSVHLTPSLAALKVQTLDSARGSRSSTNSSSSNSSSNVSSSSGDSCSTGSLSMSPFSMSAASSVGSAVGQEKHAASYPPSPNSRKQTESC